LTAVERDGVPKSDVAARIRERDQRMAAADTRTDAEKLLGDPPRLMSALAGREKGRSP
jgi:hypothetical protein